MRLACLQFASQVGDTDNNLSRADAIIDGASLDELDRLDLLVLPELAFTGYNFKSLEHISPHLEDDESRISYLWARKTALDHGCTVVVGYPEKVDAECPASPQHYNSALIVDGEGYAVGNYRKSLLHCTDETWAHKSSEGFFRRELPRLGNVCLGISTDVNPASLETAWDAFEFGIYIVEAQANVVILTMAWHRRDPILLERHPQEPDVDTLVYWVQRLEPIIRADREGEVIVVFCNKTGAEEDAIYTGTSAIIGIRQGEIFVYGVLGRGVADLLIVDTDCPPSEELKRRDCVVAEIAETIISSFQQYKAVVSDPEQESVYSQFEDDSSQEIMVGFL
ncbi:carbon-nitrogen hydrolase [Staphylotrichum tortipilum]|uniref:Carbon-nitrogen hydrolase n=1 Tax=Staphylotrichum tortipilum TaxID=2831512 RepID=A0AAN6MK20_9PEZI|nr:carbon-nitrogen hydrolase [Staphylotrichum longicolle]